MRRRDFLKGIFGAAAIAAVPTFVLKQIDELPPEPVPAIESTPPTPRLSAKRPIPENGLFYIWDKDREELVGACTDFSLNMNANFVDVTSWESPYREYIKGRPSWNIEANNVRWLVDPRELIEQHDKHHLLCLMAKDDIKFQGDIYLINFNITVPFFAEEWVINDAMFEGSGILQMIIQKG